MSAAIKGKIVSHRFLVSYRIYGSGPSIFCVNGAQQTMAAWHSSVLRFKDTYRFVLYDGPGSDRGSIQSGSKEVTVPEQIQVLHDLIHKHKEKGKPVYLVGASWGSVIAAIYAATYPNEIDRLILGSFMLRPSPKMLSMIDEAHDLYHSGQCHKGAELIIKGFGKRLPEAHKRRMVQQFETMPQAQFDAFYEHLKMIAKTGPVTDYVDLKKIKAPTLIINGAEDELLGCKDLKEMLDFIPHAELRMVPETGHFLHLENEEIFEIYADYLKRGHVYEAPGEPHQKA